MLDRLLVVVKSPRRTGLIAAATVGATVAATGMLAATGTVSALGAVAAGAATHTRVSIYTPFRTSGKPAVHIAKTIHGSCWTGSSAVSHRLAWRCMSGNLIYDPCFSTAQAKGIVLCPASGPWRARAIEIKLTKRLPTKYGNKRKPSTRGLPWALVTTSGWKCRLETGATTVLNGKRLNYFCTGTRDGLWGAPSRKRTWKIYAAPAQATTLSKRVAIKAAWF